MNEFISVPAYKINAAVKCSETHISPLLSTHKDMTVFTVQAHYQHHPANN